MKVAVISLAHMPLSESIPGDSLQSATMEDTTSASPYQEQAYLGPTKIR
jgi:hypothetical protein